MKASRLFKPAVTDMLEANAPRVGNTLLIAIDPPIGVKSIPSANVARAIHWACAEIVA